MNASARTPPLEQVKAELELIPRGDIYQNMFRAVYEQSRLHVLGRNATERLTAGEVAERAAESVRRHASDFRPAYDPELLRR